MARNYTGSPLGIIHSEKIGYSVSNNVISSIFSSTSTMNSTKEGGLLNTRRSGRNFLSQHNDEIYDLSTPHIIDKLNNISALQLKYADFAYLKDYGVYPNNRMVVVRRFENPVPDDLFSLGGGKRPMSTIIGYAKDIGSLIKIDVNEDWIESESSFKSILDDFGSKIGKSSGWGANNDKSLGSYAAGGFDILPKQFLNPFTTILQRKILIGMGIIDENSASELPIGDPNIIRESKRRKTFDLDDSGSGVKGKFNIKLTTEYEQKFINGVDPTIVYLDIINNALRMGTSESTFYLGQNNTISNTFREKIDRLSTDPTGAIQEWAKAIAKAFGEMLGELKSKITGLFTEENQPTSDEEREKQEEANRAANSEKAKEAGGILDNATNLLLEAGELIIKNIVEQYRHKLLGVITNLTGAASTPWHVTIGNPLRPIFISGDMYCKSVEIEPGNDLAFNNLPSTIKVTIALESARNLGLQEIFAKYNSGSIRTTNGKYVASGPKDFFGAKKYVYNNKPNDDLVLDLNASKEKSQSPEIDNNNPNTTTQTTKATTNNNVKVNSDANGDAVIPSTENVGGLSNTPTSETIQPVTSGVNAKIPNS